jgi:oxygen-independent coproporphyrinogen-3 oxidase
MSYNSIYVHIPFCEKRCNYCDFVSNVKDENSDLAEKYADLVIAELKQQANGQKEEIQTIYFGGGTPSVLPYEDIIKILNEIKNVFPVSEDAEITIEVNPSSTSFFPMLMYRKAGFNRISIGGQSFHDQELQTMGRIHTEEELRETINAAERAGFLHRNVDLIYGIPGQTLESWLDTVGEAAHSMANHISLYGLQLDNKSIWGKMFAEGNLQPADEDLAADMFEGAIKLLKQDGYTHYEIANFSYAIDDMDHRSRHNLAYWQRKNYLGLGLGAASCLDEKRWVNVGTLQEYAAALESGNTPKREIESLTKEQVISEAAFLALRTNIGVEIEAFNERYKVDFKTLFAEPIKKLLDQGLVTFTNKPKPMKEIPMPVSPFPSTWDFTWNNDSAEIEEPEKTPEIEVLRLTEKGIMLGNLVFEEFIL